MLLSERLAKSRAAYVLLGRDGSLRIRSAATDAIVRFNSSGTEQEATGWATFISPGDGVVMSITTNNIDRLNESSHELWITQYRKPTSYPLVTAHINPDDIYSSVHVPSMLGRKIVPDDVEHLVGLMDSARPLSHRIYNGYMRRVEALENRQRYAHIVAAIH